MPALDTGRYIITNVKYGNLAVLPDANDESDIIAGIEENNPGEKVRGCTFRSRRCRLPILPSGMSHCSTIGSLRLRITDLTILLAVRRAPRRETLSLDENAINNGLSGRRGSRVDIRRIIRSALY
jgi:hypothetical protein